MRRLALAVSGSLLLVVTAACVSTEPPRPVELTPEKAANAPAEAIAKITAKRCGATFSLGQGDLDGTDAFVVSAYPEPGRSVDMAGFPTATDVRAFIDRNRDLLEASGHAVGTWCEIDGGDCHQTGKEPTCHLDISLAMTSPDQAVRLARACNQRAIARLRPDAVKIMDNGGQGYGDGRPLAGPALDVCRKARGD